MSQQAYLKIFKGGIYLTFLTLFLVYKRFLFPYISSKQIFFNIIIEILFVIWLAFIIKYPAYAPRLRGASAGKPVWISICLIAFFAAILISCFTGVDFNLSFWGDVERMLGVFHLLHFLAFYFIIITVMRTRDDWLNLLAVSVGAAVLISLYSFKINYSTIGNSAYVGGYLIFNIYFALILFFSRRNLAFRLFLSPAVLLMLVVLEKTTVAGAYVGLGASFLLLLLLYGVLNKNKKIKIGTLSAAVVLCVLILSVFMNRDSAFVQNNNFLRFLTGEMSLSKNTFQTRLLSWEAAWLDFPNHPILGTGFGNYSTTFDKYFDPKFYNYTRSETYFDRAHNNLIDIVSTAGLAGLLTYLSIFVAVGYYLLKGFKKGGIVLHDFVLLTSLIVAYFIQNLAVFDSLVTYFSLIITLGFIYWLSESGKIMPIAKDEAFVNREIYALFFVGIIALGVIYQYNVKPAKMLYGTINGQYVIAQGDLSGGVEEYKKALRYDTVLDRDSRSSLVQVVTASQSLFSNLDRQKAGEIMDYAIGLAEENIKYNPTDSLAQMQLAQALNTAASLQTERGDKFFYYSKRAEEAVNKSIAASPGRVPIYFVKTQIYLTRGEKDKAIETLKYAVGLNEEYPDSYCQLAKILLFYKEEAEGYSAMDKCIDLDGASSLSPAGVVRQMINHYLEKKDMEKVLKLYERLSGLEENNAEIWANLANIYAQAGRKEEAKNAAEKAIELNPAIKENAEKFIQRLEE